MRVCLGFEILLKSGVDFDFFGKSEKWGVRVILYLFIKEWARREIKSRVEKEPE